VAVEVIQSALSSAFKPLPTISSPRWNNALTIQPGAEALSASASFERLLAPDEIPMNTAATLGPLFSTQQTREIWSEVLESRFTPSGYFRCAVSPYRCYLFSGDKQTLVSAIDDESAIHAAKRRPWKVTTIELVEMVRPSDMKERKYDLVPTLGLSVWNLPDFVWKLTVVNLAT
jgi:hypothetical protein